MTIEHRVQVNDLPTRYLAAGPDDAPTIVFLHEGGFGACADISWRDVLEQAAQSHRVIAPDLLGYGGTAKLTRFDEAPFGMRLRHVFALLDQLGIDRPVHLVGHCFGGSVVLRGLPDVEYGPRIASATVITGTGGPYRTAVTSELGKFDGTAQSLRTIELLNTGEFDGFEDYVERRLQWAQVPGHFASLASARTPVPEALAVARPADDWPSALSGVTTPTMFIGGRRDVLLDPDWIDHFAAVMPAAREEWIDSRHAPNITHPSEVWALIADFIGGGRAA